MKKKLLYVVVGVVLAASLAVVLLLSTNKEANRIDGAFLEIERDYAFFLGKASAAITEEDEKELTEEFAQLLFRISQGKKNSKKEYAQLLREITHGDFSFEDNEVFSMAEELAQLIMEMAEGTLDYGVQRVRITEAKRGKKILVIDHIGARAYSVRTLTEEWVYVNESEKHFDVRDLGDYRVLINFSDTAASMEFCDKYAPGIAHEVQDMLNDITTNFKIGITHTNHSLQIILGSDEPINVTEQEYVRVDRPKGSIEIALN